MRFFWLQNRNKTPHSIGFAIRHLRNQRFEISFQSTASKKLSEYINLKLFCQTVDYILRQKATNDTIAFSGGWVLLSDFCSLFCRLATINEGIAQKMASQTEFDKAISETQLAYSRVMQSSQALLQSLHGAAANLRTKEAATDPEVSSKLPKFAKKVQIKGFTNWVLLTWENER